MTREASTAKPAIYLRVFWGSLRALSLLLCCVGFLLFGFGVLKLLDIITDPFIQIIANGREYPDYRREEAILLLLLMAFAWGLSATMFWLWRSIGRKQVGAAPVEICPHCGEPL